MRCQTDWCLLGGTISCSVPWDDEVDFSKRCLGLSSWVQLSLFQLVFLIRYDLDDWEPSVLYNAGNQMKNQRVLFTFLVYFPHAAFCFLEVLCIYSSSVAVFNKVTVASLPLSRLLGYNHRLGPRTPIYTHLLLGLMRAYEGVHLVHIPAECETGFICRLSHLDIACAR